MQNNQVTYEYAVIRIVPKVEREEFLNVGVIVYSKHKKYLEMKYHIDRPRLTAFSPSVDVDLIEAYLNAWALICKGGKEGGTIGEAELPYRFRWLTASRSTILQSSKQHPGICDDPQKVLEHLFERYVL